MTQHVLFTKVGWMEDYKGVTDNDPKPEGAGRWNENENNVGGEAWNFLAVGGACYGFAETKAHDHGFNLPRVAPGATGPSLSGVLLVFLANVPNESSPNETRRQLYSKIGKGIRIVGWYRNCEIYSTCRKLQSGLRDLHSGSYNAMCSVEDAVLVPVADRKSPIDLSGKGGMLRSNVRYLYSEAGQRKKWPWMDEVLKLIATHESNAKRLGPEILYPDEIREPEKFFEGAKKQVVVNAYERDSNAREKCIALYGYGATLADSTSRRPTESSAEHISMCIT